MQAHSCAARGLRRESAELRKLVAEHDDRVADHQLGVHDFAVRAFHDASFFCAEGLLVKFDRADRVAHGKKRGESVVSIGNWFYGHTASLGRTFSESSVHQKRGTNVNVRRKSRFLRSLTTK